MSIVDDSQSLATSGAIDASDRALVLGQELIEDFNTQMISSTEEIIAPQSTKPVKDADTIYEYVRKYNIESVNIANLQKLNEKELINVPFFQKLKKLFNPHMIKSHLMTALGIRTSYTGFHEFMKGDREDLPSVGICSIAKTVGYNVLILPIPEDLSDLEMARLNTYREEFLEKVEQKISEKNIPTVRSKSRGKAQDKPKEINTSFISNLSIDAGSLIDHTTTGLSEIGEHSTFDDKLGKFEYELPNDGEIVPLNNPEHFGSREEDFTMLDTEIPFKVDMSGYDDNLGMDFGKVITEDDLELYENAFEINKK